MFSNSKTELTISQQGFKTSSTNKFKRFYKFNSFSYKIYYFRPIIVIFFVWNINSNASIIKGQR